MVSREHVPPCSCTGCVLCPCSRADPGLGVVQDAVEPLSRNLTDIFRAGALLCRGVCSRRRGVVCLEWVAPFPGLQWLRCSVISAARLRAWVLA
jgi:hypothetical protein